VVLLPRGADGRDYVFQGMRAREFPVKAGTDQALQGRVSVSPETTGRRDFDNGTRNQDAVAPRGMVDASSSGMRGVSIGASESESDGSSVEGRPSSGQGRSLEEHEHVHTGVSVGVTSGATVHAQVTSAKNGNPGMGKISPATDPRILGVAMVTESASLPGHQERTNEQNMAQMNNVVNIVPRPPEYHMPQPNVPYVRPPEQHKHMYQGIITGGTSRTYASSRADIMNYSEPGEDLDWTRVTDPYERKRMQNLINGRKYRERMLAIDGKSRSGGNYPGASGVGGRISTGYGPRRGSGQQEEPYAVQNLRSSLEYHSASREDAVSRASPKPKEEDQQDDFLSLVADWVQNESPAAPEGTNDNSNLQSGAAQFPPPRTDKPRPHICGTCSRSFARTEHLKRHELSHTKEKPFECPECSRCFARRDLLQRHHQALHTTNLASSAGERASVIRQLLPRHANISDSTPQTGLTPESTPMHESGDTSADDNAEGPAQNTDTSDADLFECNKPTKTAFNIFVRAAHDAHRFPADTPTLVVEKYHMYIRQIWSCLLEEHKAVWRTTATTRDHLSDAELSIKGQNLLWSQGLLGEFLPHVEPSFP
jgi:hypothetical protein